MFNKYRMRQASEQIERIQSGRCASASTLATSMKLHLMNVGRTCRRLCQTPPAFAALALDWYLGRTNVDFRLRLQNRTLAGP